MKILTARSANEYLYFPPINEQPPPPIPRKAFRWSVKSIDSFLRVEVHNPVAKDLNLQTIIDIVRQFKEDRADRYSADGKRLAGEWLAWLEDPRTEVEIVYKSDAKAKI